MEEVIGLIVANNIYAAKHLADEFYFNLSKVIESNINYSFTDVVIDRENYSVSITFENKKYIYLFRSINSLGIDGLHISGFTMTPSLLTKEPTEKIIETIIRLKTISLINENNPFGPLDCLLPGFIR